MGNDAGKVRHGGREGRRRERVGNTASVPGRPYITRNIPTYDILGEESLIRIERAADRILAEVGIDFRDDPEALALWRKAGAHIDGLRVDTNRDGFDIDACRNVRISNVYVNSPNDDAIVLKSSYALGFNRATENVTITNSQVSGFDLGTFLDGTFKTTQEFAPDKDRVTGRLKFGTESNGGFKNITISNINFVHCRGLALETVCANTTPICPAGTCTHGRFSTA